MGRNVPEQTQIEPVARWGKDDGYVDSIRISTDPQRRKGLGPGGTALRSGQPAVCNDIDADHEHFAFRKEALARGYRSCAAFPLKLDGRPVAVFLVYAAEPLYFDDNELALLASLAENFSFAIGARKKDRQRARAQAALRASEARLRAVIDNEPECVKIMSRSCELLDINPASLKMIQAPSLEAVLGKNVLDFIHPADRDAYLALHQRVCAGETGQLQVRAMGMLGTMLWMDAHAVPLREDDGTVSGVLYVTRDVTEQKASLERLQHSQTLLAMASRLGRIGAWEVELPARAVAWSDELSVIHEMPAGYSPSFDEALEFYAPEYRVPVAQALKACGDTGTPFDLELEIVTGRGRRLCVRSVRRIVSRHSGRVWAHSRPSRGATFYFTLGSEPA